MWFKKSGSMHFNEHVPMWFKKNYPTGKILNACNNQFTGFFTQALPLQILSPRREEFLLL